MLVLLTYILLLSNNPKLPDLSKNALEAPFTRMSKIFDAAADAVSVISIMPAAKETPDAFPDSVVLIGGDDVVPIPTLPDPSSYRPVDAPIVPAVSKNRGTRPTVVVEGIRVSDPLPVPAAPVAPVGPVGPVAPGAATWVHFVTSKAPVEVCAVVQTYVPPLYVTVEAGGPTT